MKLRNCIAAFLLCLLASSSAFATQLTGTVTNGTTNKPSPREQVALLSLANGMDEISHTTTDSQGHYSLNIPDDQAHHLVRVTRQSVGYFKAVPPGATTADVTVYDAATQLESIATSARVFHFQASGGNLDVSDRYILNNQSLPPRSRIGNQTFAVILPNGAELGEASITGPGGMPLVVTPVPSGIKNRYAFDFPIRPGETKFELFYRLPYSGQYEFSLTPEGPLAELGVLLPKSMKFTGISTGFAQDSDEAGLAVFFAKDMVANQPVKFSLSGEGLISQTSSQDAAPGNAPADNTPTPSSAATPQNSAVWYITGAIAGVMVGIILVLWRKTSRKSAARPFKASKSSIKASASQSQSAAPEPEDMLGVLKEELFQLETDRLNGKISEEEYIKTKAGLDTLLRRQMTRK